VHSASLTLNEAKDTNKTFSILHVKDSEPFLCQLTRQDDFKEIVVCQFSQSITTAISKSNSDFSITSSGNKLKIIPKSKVKLQAIQDDFITSDVVKSLSNTEQKHWIIVAYKDDIALFQNSKREGLNFDIVFNPRELPFIGSLDLDGLPIVQKADAVAMRQIRNSYQKKDLEQVISLADKELSQKGATYAHEEKLYKLRAMDKLAWEMGEESDVDTDELIELAQEWIDENPSSKYLPEVLMYISKTYYKRGYTAKGDEYSDILKDEFASNKFNLIAQLHKADMVYQNRKRRKEALKIYKDVLYDTDDVNLASKAASKLTEKYLQMGQVDKAEEFYTKVVDANKAYIQSHLKEAYGFAKEFAQAKKYEIAIKIVGLFLEVKENPHADEMRKDIAYWYELSGDKKAGFTLYKQYLKDYPKSEYIGFVKSRLDKILLDIDEKNETKKIANIDNILKNYSDDPIYKKALIEKAKILIEDGKYEELFALEKPLKENGGEKFLAFGAQKKIGEDLQKDNCKDAIYLKDEYNVTVKPKHDEKFFNCLMRTAQYKEALEITKKHKDEKDLKRRLLWLYHALKAYSKLDHNKEVIMIGEDIEKLSIMLQTIKYNDIVYEKAIAYYNLQKYDDMMLREVEKVEQFFPKNIRNIDLFNKVLRYAKSSKNDLLIVKYAQKIIELQKQHKIDDYSPTVEIDLVNALKRLKQYDKALKEDVKLLYIKLTDAQRANVLFLAGDLSLKLSKQKEAKEFFIKCGEIVEDSSWQRLCAESLKLFEE